MSTLTTVLAAPVSRRARREHLYVLATLPPAVPPFALALLGAVAAAMSMVMVGLPVLAAVLVGARATVPYFRGPARAILGWDWPSPEPIPGGSLLSRATALLRDGRGWRALAYGLVKLPLTAATAYLATVALVVGVAGVTRPLWWFLSPGAFGLIADDSWRHSWVLAAEGLAALLAYPWILRVLVGIDRILTVALLAPGRDQARVAELVAGRSTLTADAEATLRRLERDLHDGTQARLVSIGMMLGRLDTRVADPQAREIIAMAQHAVTDGLTELREIIRGMHPPALDDGLATALSTLASRSPIPAQVHYRALGRPPDTYATTLYFTATELLTNVARHAEATTVEVAVDENDDAFVLTVADDGCGGAQPANGQSGLAGLRRRAEALDGSLAIDSPAGGPTRVTMTLPKKER